MRAIIEVHNSIFLQKAFVWLWISIPYLEHINKFFVDVTNACKWLKCFISEVSMEQQECEDLHTVTTMFPYTVLTFIISDTAPQRDQFFLSKLFLVLILFLHVQRTDSWKCKHPVVKSILVLICVFEFVQHKSGKRIEYFCEDYNLFILKVTDPNVNSSGDINKKALSVEHEVAHYVCVA